MTSWFVVMSVGLTLSMSDLTGVFFAKSRRVFVASVLLMAVGIVMYFGPLMRLN